MSTATLVTNTGYASTPVFVPAGGMVTAHPLNGVGAYIEYSVCDQHAVNCGSATWNVWRHNNVIVQTSDMPLEACFARLVSSVAGAKISMDNAPENDPSDPFSISVKPVSGETIQMTNDKRSGTLILTHESTLDTLTLALPTFANSKPNQFRFIYFNKAVTSLAFAGATVMGAPEAVSAGDFICIRYISPNLWAKQI